MKKLIIAANLGRVRVLRVREPGDDPAERRHLVEVSSESIKERVKAIHELVTDQSGRFPQGGPPGMRTGSSAGEEHELEAEMERKGIRRIAGHIDRILKHEGHPHWTLAAPRPILARLLAALSKSAADCIGRTVGADLTGSPLPELERRFT